MGGVKAHLHAADTLSAEVDADFGLLLSLETLLRAQAICLSSIWQTDLQGLFHVPGSDREKTCKLSVHSYNWGSI